MKTPLCIFIGAVTCSLTASQNLDNRSLKQVEEDILTTLHTRIPAGFSYRGLKANSPYYKASVDAECFGNVEEEASLHITKTPHPLAFLLGWFYFSGTYATPRPDSSKTIESLSFIPPQEQLLREQLSQLTALDDLLKYPDLCIPVRGLRDERLSIYIKKMTLYLLRFKRTWSMLARHCATHSDGKKLFEKGLYRKIWEETESSIASYSGPVTHSKTTSVFCHPWLYYLVSNTTPRIPEQFITAFVYGLWDASTRVPLLKNLPLTIAETTSSSQPTTTASWTVAEVADDLLKTPDYKIGDTSVSLIERLLIYATRTVSTK